MPRPILLVVALTVVVAGIGFAAPVLLTRVAIGPVAGTGLAPADAAAARPVPVAAPADLPDADRRVFVLGDSLTVGVSPYLPALLAADRRPVTIDGEVGRLTTTGLRILAARVGEVGGTLVVALGTNDTPDPALLSSRLDQLMMIAGRRRVIWVTVARSGWDGFDQALVAAQTRWPNLDVVDWRPVIELHQDMLAFDGIHLTDAGYRLRAMFIAAAVETSA